MSLFEVFQKSHVLCFFCFIIIIIISHSCFASLLRCSDAFHKWIDAKAFESDRISNQFYRVRHIFRLTKRDDYFRVTFDHFWSKRHFLCYQLTFSARFGKPQAHLFLSRVIKLLINATLFSSPPRFSSTFSF